MPITTSMQSTQRGFALIEVMVTAFIIAIGLSGIGVLLLKSIQGTQDSAQRSQGMWIVQDFVGRIRANPEGAKANGYVIAANPDCNNPPAIMCSDYINNGVRQDASICTPTQMATFDIYITMCGFDPVPANPDDKIFDSPAEFIVKPQLTSSCDLSVGLNCVQYTVDLKWTSRITKGAANAAERINENNFTTVIELN